MPDNHLVAARRAALGALQAACERNVIRSEMREIECYTDAYSVGLGQLDLSAQLS